MSDYAELVKGLRCCSKIDARNNGCDSCPYEYCGDDCQNLCGRAADAIEELLAAVPHWISVEDELPEKSEIVLVAYDNGVVAQGMLFFGKFRGANFGFDENDEPIIAEVTHWMPLPAPPKEDADNG